MSQETLDQEKDVFAWDSLGTPIIEDSIVITGNTGWFCNRVSDSASAANLDRCVVYSADRVENFLERYTTIEVPEGAIFNLDDLLNRGRGYWESAASVLRKLEQNSKYLPTAEEVALLDLVKFPLNDSTYIMDVQETDTSITVELMDVKDAMGSVTIDKNAGTSLSDTYGAYVGSVIVDVSGTRRLVFSKSKVDEELSPVVPNPVERLDNEDKVLARLQKDFPWISKDDLNNGYIDTFVLNANNEWLSHVDLNRHKNIYPKGRQNEIWTARAPGLSEWEQRYIAVRNYARTVEACTWLENLDNPDILSSKKELQGVITSMPPQERLTTVLSSVARLQHETAEFVAPRVAEERRVFGKALTPSGMILDRFASEDTINYGRAVGLYSHGIISLRSEVKGSVFRTLRDLPPEERKAAAYRLFSDVLAHENGHGGLDDTRAQFSSLERFGSNLSKPINWHCEEIWNEWKSVVFPSVLRGEAPPFPSAYLENPYTHERGGAYAIQDMYQELLTAVRETDIRIKQGKSRAQKLDGDYITRSILATAFMRVPHGEVSYEGKTMVSFPDLYDLVHARLGKKTRFYEHVSGCNDRDYDSFNKQPFDVSKSPDNTDLNNAYKVIEAAYTNKLKNQLEL